MRGTLHVLASDEAAAYLGLLASTRSWERPVWQRSFITTAQLASIRSIVGEALADGPKTREQLVAAVESGSSDVALVGQVRSGWGTVHKPLAWLRELCDAPANRSQVSFARPLTSSPVGAASSIRRRPLGSSCLASLRAMARQQKRTSWAG
jgi:hypothetical protein